MIEDIEKLEQIFVHADDVDEDSRKENVEMIKNWRESLIAAEAYQSWVEHDTTKKIAQQAKDSYLEMALKIVNTRHMSDDLRLSTYARMDAMLWILSLVKKDMKGEMETIHQEIKRSLSSFS